MTILLVVGILVFLIIVHEIGHFVVAKLFGVKVEEFGVGYPPRAFTFGRWGGTEYTLNWIPFGGFVRLFGDVGEGESGEGSLVSKNRAVQAAILFAGVLMNLLVAWLLFAGALYIGTPRVVESVSSGVPVSLLVAEVVPSSPAHSAGIMSGDRIVSVTGISGERSELTPQTVTDFVQGRGGEEIEISYERAGETLTTTVRPAHAVNPNAADQPAIGVALVLVTSEPLPFFQALKGAFVSTRNAIEITATGSWKMIKDLTNGIPTLEDIKDVAGPIGLVGIVGDAAENGVGQILTLAAFISVNLFIINLLPIPALDGGRLFILGIETVIRRNAPQLAMRLVNVFGITLLIVLMVFVTYNDIARLFT